MGSAIMPDDHGQYDDKKTQKVSLWVRTTKEGRIIWSAGKKEWLNTPESLKDQVFYDVELKGEIDVQDQETQTEM